ncbi:uncharacterized protein ACIB01_016118 isoform 1-T1 [Guaruba guarouba]
MLLSFWGPVGKRAPAAPGCALCLMRLGKAESAANPPLESSWEGAQVFFPLEKHSCISCASCSVSGLQCYGCNIIVGTKNVDKGCSHPEVITCSHSHQGFRHRFCIKTESVVLGTPLTSGCATSRHCQQQELPGVRIHCCDTDLCNGSPTAPRPPPGIAVLLLPCVLAALLLS